MHRKFSLSRKRTQHVFITLGVCILGACIFAVIGYSFIKIYPTQTIQIFGKENKTSPLDTEPEISRPSMPVLIQIPRIKVNAKIDYMGLTKSGDMDSPVNIANGGWYKHGPLPGNTGSSVIAGHKSGLKGVPGIFSELGKLQKGDEIIIIDDKAQRVIFTVRETRSYEEDEKPSEVFNSISGVHLNLITCTGSWNSADRLYSKRLVVFSDKKQ